MVGAAGGCPAAHEPSYVGCYAAPTTNTLGTIMLVLSRRIGESIVIGDHVTVTLLEVQGGQIRLGIQAPREVTVHRSEVLDAITAAEDPDHTALSD